MSEAEERKAVLKQLEVSLEKLKTEAESVGLSLIASMIDAALVETRTHQGR